MLYRSREKNNICIASYDQLDVKLTPKIPVKFTKLIIKNMSFRENVISFFVLRYNVHTIFPRIVLILGNKANAATQH